MLAAQDDDDDDDDFSYLPSFFSLVLCSSSDHSSTSPGNLPKEISIRLG